LTTGGVIMPITKSLKRVCCGWCTKNVRSNTGSWFNTTINMSHLSKTIHRAPLRV
jgi:hypothetical protein